MPERQHEIALARDEVDTILRHCGPDSLLVGGQALAFWAQYYEIEPVGALSAKITSDADFIGTAADAKRLGEALKWKVWRATMDDATGQTAKVTTTHPRGGVKQVDYLRGIVGLDTAKIQARAVAVSLSPGITIRILHPLDVLESRLRNLEALPEKRNAVGVAQARLAIDIAGRFVSAMLDSGGEPRRVLDAIERVAGIALDSRLAAVALDYGLDPLSVVPVSRIDCPAFRERRWPQIMDAFAEIKRKRARTGIGRAPSRKPRPRT